ncbi:Cys/Met metabolism PLP-dependent enzyme [Fragilaria crotonensis]|nr:Cys/Met metabolism PLP-dependent enzyme [Fragilaria crotonensis]
MYPVANIFARLHARVPNMERSVLAQLRRGLAYRTTALGNEQLAGKRAADAASAVPTPKKSMATILSHAGVDGTVANAPMSPPLSLATTYTRPPDGIYLDEHWIYSRENSPNKAMLEKTVTKLECHGDERDYEGVSSCAFASGMAGVNAIVMAHGSSTTVLFPTDTYHGIPTLLTDVLSILGVSSQRVDVRNLETVVQHAKAVTTDNVIVWMETPSNPQCHVIDVAAVCKALQSAELPAKLTTVVDSTMCPPCLTQPLRLGADVVFHSGTKYMAGHSDALLGLVTTSPWTVRGRELSTTLVDIQIKAGAVASPFDSWLTLRGLRTLHIRVERVCQNALQLAKFLDSQATVKVVHYPGLESHPQHEIAKKQMKGGYGGVFSFEMETEVEAMAVAGALRLVHRATSLGGTETLIEHRASIEPAGRVVSPPGLLRVSVGIENVDDLLDDFRTALMIAKEVTAAL